jgi:hypothetical protein
MADAHQPDAEGAGRMPVDVKGIFDGIDTSTFAAVKAAIDKKDGKEFETAYRGALESCYQCHKAVGRPYLRPMIPKALAANHHQSRRASELAPVKPAGEVESRTSSCDIANDIEPTVSAGSELPFSVPTMASSRQQASSWASLPRTRIAVRF